MINVLPKLKNLQEEINSQYSIRVIDFEPCLYRDFGNGFNVEISGCNTRRRKTKATIYLWFGDKCGSCVLVKTLHDVERTASAISNATETLFTLSQNLIKQGYNNYDMLWGKHISETEVVEIKEHVHL
jgi:hypothetical protein